ncbi:hypothetical protein [Nocardioides yefusunii]|uniref:Uncharacterized protein n=1 Tax=Nocardioides yefusunii TaxID=2500546 RepID=A0ABW1QWS5_9ACTN|nr:hypothetical protein [Nocardioides yefusunii]
MLKILLFVFAVALVVYALVMFVDKRVARRKQAPKPVAPDDDLNFLRNLEWEQRKERNRRRKDDDEEPGDEPSDDDQPDTP